MLNPGRFQGVFGINPPEESDSDQIERQYYLRRMVFRFAFLCSVFSILFVLHSSAQRKLKNNDRRDVDFTISGYYYSIPQNDDQIMFIGTAEAGKWHLEGRYNYEDVKTGSVFGGYTFSTDGWLKADFTPMIGFVFGNSDGVAPGLEMDLSYKKFGFYSESEYVIYYRGYTNNFIYTWNELTYNAFKNFDVGVSIQRTLLYQTKFDIQRGAFMRYDFWKLSAGVYYFNPFSSDNLWIFSLEVSL